MRNEEWRCKSPRGFVLIEDFTRTTVDIPFPYINEIRKDFYHNSSFLIPNSSLNVKDRPETRRL